MEKIAVCIDGRKLYLRSSRQYCRHCGSMEPEVVINQKVIPCGKQDLLSEGKPVVVCLGCLETGNYKHRREKIFQALSLPEPEAAPLRALQPLTT